YTLSLHDALPIFVLKLLSRKEMYGYEIVKAIQLQTKERISFGEGCIYPYLHHLEREKLVTSRRTEVSGRSRIHYRLTPRGNKRLEKLVVEWSQVAAGISALMTDQHA